MNYSSKQHTFVICAYKKSQYLESCIQSLVNQSVPSQIIISTSTPCQQTKDLSEKYHLPLIINHAKPSIASDWNFAFSNCNTQLVTLAHQDDIYNKEYTAQMLQFINQSTNPIIYFCGYGELRNEQIVLSNTLLNIKKIMLNPLNKKKNWSNKIVRRRILSFGSPICCPSVTYIKSNNNTPFNLKLKCNLDWDKWEQLSKIDGSFVYNSTPLMYHRIHSESETSALIQNQVRSKEDFEILRRFWGSKTAMIISKIYGLSQKSNKIF